MYEEPMDIDFDDVSQPSHLDKLPVELLIHIISFCLEDNPDLVATLSQVNSKWRGYINTSPTLWQHLKLSDAKFDPQRLYVRSRLWVDRSGRLPLDVEVDSVHHDSVLPMLSNALMGLDRWRSFSGTSRIQFAYTSKFAVDVTDDGKRPPIVLAVHLHPNHEITTDLGDDVLEDAPKEPKHVEEFTAEKGNLREIHVKGVRTLPKADMLTPFSAISILAIHNIGWRDMPAHQCVSFLTAFPSLASLTIINRFVQDPEHRPDCSQTQPALLPHLTTLVVSIASTRCLLSHLTTPALLTLSLMYVNSSTEYDHPQPPYEPGDSDDEARDFSRSPWTDRATGMGLRSLFSRAEPPLRELVMDYADLRTKDFQWAFSRMRHLESLRVVASDMSDKVAHALSVKSTDGMDEINAAQACAPLPKLSKLYLDKCQKVSGDVIVEMLKSRLRAANRGLVAPLEKIDLLECSGVAPHHRDRLVRFMGAANHKIVSYRPSMGEE